VVAAEVALDFLLDFSGSLLAAAAERPVVCAGAGGWVRAPSSGVIAALLAALTGSRGAAATPPGTATVVSPSPR
jgi:hypothetical protein